MDSSGIKMMDEGEWKVKRHDADYRRQSRKLHLGIDAQTQEIRAMEVTDNRTGDATMDVGRAAHAAIADRGAVAIIPPRRNGQFCKGCLLVNQARNESLRSVKYLVRTLWRTWRGCPRHSLVETKTSCFKLLADRVESQDFDQQVSELQKICAAMLNRFTVLGTPQTVRMK